MFDFDDLSSLTREGSEVIMRDFDGNEARFSFQCREDAQNCWEDISAHYVDCSEFMIPVCIASYEPLWILNDSIDAGLKLASEVAEVA